MVTGAGGPAGINFIASLRMARRSWHIVGVDANRWHLELPQVDARYLVPRALDPDYIPTLNRIIKAEGIEFVQPQPDIEVKVISEHRDEIDARTFLPAQETVRICQDKMETTLRLRRAGVDVPDSHHIERIEDISGILDKLQTREGRVWLRAIRGAGSRAALVVRTPRQARGWIHYWKTMRGLEAKDFMMSEYLPGDEYAFQSLWNEGELVTSACRRRLEYLFGHLTVTGQSSSPSVAVTVHNEEVNEVAARAVQSIDRQATGVFCLDLKENSAGVPCVTEINAGRFFTTNNFFARLGANMPADLVRLGLGEELSPRPKHNAVPENFYWIRLVDAGPVLVKGGEWQSKTL